MAEYILGTKLSTTIYKWESDGVVDLYGNPTYVEKPIQSAIFDKLKTVLGTNMKETTSTTQVYVKDFISYEDKIDILEEGRELTDIKKSLIILRIDTLRDIHQKVKGYKVYL